MYYFQPKLTYSNQSKLILTHRHTYPPPEHIYGLRWTAVKVAGDDIGDIVARGYFLKSTRPTIYCYFDNGWNVLFLVWERRFSFSFLYDFSVSVWNAWSKLRVENADFTYVYQIPTSDFQKSNHQKTFFNWYRNVSFETSIRHTKYDYFIYQQLKNIKKLMCSKQGDLPWLVK